MRRVATAAVLLVAALSFAAGAASADTPEPAAAPKRETLAAEVVVVGVWENTDQLTHDIEDILRLRQISTHFRYRSELSERDLTARQDVMQPTVWILFPEFATVRLVFADYARQLFIVRDIPLPQGLDELGRESIGQVVESSLMALLHGETSATRAEARSALGRYLTPPPSPAQPPPAAAQSKAQPRTRGRRISHRLGVRYLTAWSGSDFGVAQGPGIFSGIEAEGPHDALFVVGAFDWHLAQRYDGSPFDVTIQSNRGWLLFGWRRALRGLLNGIASIGPGLDVTRMTPVSNAPEATAEPSAIAWSPWMRAQVGLEYGRAPICFELLLVGDLALYRTHYDVVDRFGKSSVLARPPLFRPGLTLGMVWR